MVIVKLEREDEEETSPQVIAPFFPQVSYTIITNSSSWIFLSTEKRGRMVGSYWRP